RSTAAPTSTCCWPIVSRFARRLRTSSTSSSATDRNRSTSSVGLNPTQPPATVTRPQRSASAAGSSGCGVSTRCGPVTKPSGSTLISDNLVLQLREPQLDLPLRGLRRVRPVHQVVLHFQAVVAADARSEEHTSELQSRENLVC